MDIDSKYFHTKAFLAYFPNLLTRSFCSRIINLVYKNGADFPLNSFFWKSFSRVVMNNKEVISIAPSYLLGHGTEKGYCGQPTKTTWEIEKWQLNAIGIFLTSSSSFSCLFAFSFLDICFYINRRWFIQINYRFSRIRVLRICCVQDSGCVPNFLTEM